MVSHARQLGTFLLCRHFGTLHGEPGKRAGKSSHKRPVPNGLASKVWRITGLDLYYLTMGKITKLKPQVDGLSKIEIAGMDGGLRISPVIRHSFELELK